ncbi:MAG: elongation factor T [Parcubacteria group bacterium Gr01-1014_18]|nr:MAG: elongation factor T [Parcubacteria group bacterium Greene0416_36]TSC81564.1 MAG: elongation factor T [Parcubacteria group bacterium Gr01-1014_18]TSC99625.1 MAG: elongation factor T [Parcubacteria group bacterium Greene1014_20]TSD07076.1 MAG: elongation factor T [Parcubacteria group bacterium Greene0714_2]
MNIDSKLVSELRARTGAGIVDCKKALEANGGDMDKSAEYLRKQGILKADKKNDRTAGEGLVGMYLHANGKVATMVEVRCETDFVARNEEFKELAKDLAMQAAAGNPLFVSIASVPTEAVEKEKEILREQLRKEGKKEEMLDKILEGKLKTYYQDNCLLEQKFIKDDTKTVSDLVKEKIARLGEKIEVTRFTRYQI